MAGILLTTTAATIVPAAYAEVDDHDDKNGDGNKQKAEDNSAGAIADCDDNDVDLSDLECFGIAVNDIDVDLGGNGPTPPPPEVECEECFEDLIDSEVQQLAVEIADQFDIEFPAGSDRGEILTIICEALERGPPDGLTVENVDAAMAQIDTINQTLRDVIQACLNNPILGTPTYKHSIKEHMMPFH
jgi:hypothetical protein